MSAAGLLAKVWERYQRCSSYQDSGEATTIYLPDRRERRRPFQTAFVRPDRFRFEFWKQPRNGTKEDPFVVWAADPMVHSWWSAEPEVETFNTILEALAGPIGISGGSAGLVPSLLLERNPDRAWLMRAFREARPSGIEWMHGCECMHLRVANTDDRFEIPGPPPRSLKQTRRLERLGILEAPDPPSRLPYLARVLAEAPRPYSSRWQWRSLWISLADGSIRRMVERTDFGAFASETTTVWRPAFDGMIPIERLSFHPPTREKPSPLS